MCTTAATPAWMRAAPTESSISSAGSSASSWWRGPRTSSTSRTPRCAASRPSGPTSSSACGPGSEAGAMIDGLAVWIGPEAVALTAATPLSVLSSAVWGGGLVSARAIVNLHVALDDPCTDPPRMLRAYARAQSVPEPYVGLATGAWTERGTVGEERGAVSQTLAV